MLAWLMLWQLGVARGFGITTASCDGFVLLLEWHMLF
jgi:hypothetical protein